MNDKRNGRPFCLFKVDDHYVSYLKQFDPKVVQTVYGKNQFKPFIGPVMESNGVKFYVPITSPKAKYINLKDNITFFNIIPESQQQVVGTLLIGNMIPIPDDYLQHINYDHMERYMEVNRYNERKMGQYGHLMELQLRQANKEALSIQEKANKCYEVKRDHPYYGVCNFCNEYNLLIEKAEHYQIIQNSKKKSVLDQLSHYKKQQSPKRPSRKYPQRKKELG